MALGLGLDQLQSRRGAPEGVQVAGLKEELLKALLEEIIRSHAEQAAKAAAKPIGAAEFLGRASPGETTTADFLKRANTPPPVPPGPGPIKSGLAAGSVAGATGLLANELTKEQESQLPPGFKFADEASVLPPGFKFVDEGKGTPFPEGYDPLAATAGVAPAGSTPVGLSMLKRLLEVPKRAFEASEQMRAGEGYDPGPILDAATLMMGGRGAFGAVKGKMK